MSTARSVVPFSSWVVWFADQEYRSSQSDVARRIANFFAEWPTLNVGQMLTDTMIRSLSGGLTPPHRIALLLRFLRLMYRITILPLLVAVNAETEDLTLRDFNIRHVYVVWDGANPTERWVGNDASGLVVVRTTRSQSRLELKITLFQLAPPEPYAFTASSLHTDWSALWSDDAFDASELRPRFSTNVGLGAPVGPITDNVHWLAGMLMLQELMPGLMTQNPWRAPTHGTLNRALSRLELDLPQHRLLASIIHLLPHNQSIQQAIRWMHDEVANIFARMQRTMQNIMPHKNTALDYSSSARDQFLIDLVLAENFDDQARDFLRQTISLFWYARTYNIASELAIAQGGNEIEME